LNLSKEEKIIVLQPKTGLAIGNCLIACVAPLLLDLIARKEELMLFLEHESTRVSSVLAPKIRGSSVIDSIRCLIRIISK